MSSLQHCATSDWSLAARRGHRQSALGIGRAAVYRCWKRVRSDRYATMTLLMLIRYRCRLLAEFDVGREQVRRNHRASTRGSRTLRLVQGIDAFIGF